jgi:hypothetical protein
VRKTRKKQEDSPIILASCSVYLTLLATDISTPGLFRFAMAGVFSSHYLIDRFYTCCFCLIPASKKNSNALNGCCAYLFYTSPYPSIKKTISILGGEILKRIITILKALQGKNEIFLSSPKLTPV